MFARFCSAEGEVVFEVNELTLRLACLYGHSPVIKMSELSQLCASEHKENETAVTRLVVVERKVVTAPQVHEGRRRLRRRRRSWRSKRQLKFSLKYS